MTATPNRGYELPIKADLNLSFDKVVAAFGAIDSDVAAAFAALALRAPIEDAALAGESTASTPDPGDSSNRIATTEFVTNLLVSFTPSNIDADDIITGTLDDARLSFQVSAFARTLLDDNTAGNARTTLGVYSTAQVDAIITNLVGGAPTLLDTLNEFAIALGNDPNFATTITTSLSGKISSSLLTTQGDLIVRGASAPQRLGKGTAKQTFRMNSAGTMPEWGSEAYDLGYRVSNVFLAAGTVTNAAALTIDLSAYIANGITEFDLQVRDLVPVTDNVALKLEVSTNAGSSFISTSTYRWTEFYVNNSPADGGNGSDSATFIQLSGAVGNGTGEFIQTDLNMFCGPNRYTFSAKTVQYNAAGDNSLGMLAGSNAAASVNAIRLSLSSGNIASCSWVLRGRRSS